MTFRLKIVQNDFKAFEVDASKEEMEAMIESIKRDIPYFAENGKGIYIPYVSVRYILIENREDLCQQKNPSLEAVIYHHPHLGNLQYNYVIALQRVIQTLYARPAFH